MQHLDVAAQVATKQRALEDALWHLGKVRPERVLRPMRGPDWGYRQRARLSVRHVVKKGTVLVGFHERKSSFVAEIRSCDVLPRHVSDLIMPLRALVAAMPARDRLPQIELAVGDRVTALVLRHLEPLVDADIALLREFARQHGVEWWLQPKGPDTAHPLDGTASALAYRLPEFGLHMPFRPTDFTQVNHQINEALVSRALRLLAPAADEFVIDWFCGLGNFTLPLATRAGRVLGIEGSAALLERPRAAAALNGLAGKTSFAARNLFEIGADDLIELGSAARWLIDPPREGAFAIAKALADLCDADRPAGRRCLVAAAAANRLRQLQPGDARARRRPARPSRRLPLLGGRRHQHVPAHGARREHRRLRPGRGRPVTEPVAVPLWLLVVLVGLALFAALEWLLLPSVRWYFRRKVRRVMNEISTRFKIELPEFKLTRRRALLDRLTTDPRVLAAVQQHAVESGVPRDVLIQRVHRYAGEIVPAFNAYVYFRVGYWLAKTFAQMAYRVRLGYTDEAALAAIQPSSTVVFVMNHRSNMDYVLVSFLAAERVALSYAVGEWARIWPLQGLIRAMGAYFVRRNSGDPLYRMVLQRYVQMATEGGVPQAMYPEGGLTTDGRLREPKLGLLDYMLKGFDPAAERDLVFIPVGINYDRVLEDRSLLRKLDPSAAASACGASSRSWRGSRRARRSWRCAGAAIATATPASTSARRCRCAPMSPRTASTSAPSTMPAGASPWPRSAGC